jgi:exopolysaccharide biosynthesis galactosyltransferase PssJ
MRNILTFIVPVRHQDNAPNWQNVKRHLRDTILSISRQQGEGWKAIIVANQGADLPEIPRGFEVARVDFPPNALYTQGKAEQEEFYNALRSDKGRRVLAAMLHAGQMGHVMIVDDDDFISRRLTSFVHANPQANGWYIRDGYIWSDGGRLLYRSADFFRMCGTSHIVRADLYRIPPSLEAADETYIRRMLGSHRFICDDLDASGTPLAPLPFIGAVYRTGHTESYIGSRTILKQYFLRKDLLKDPRELARRALRLKLKNHQIEQEFFGVSSR